MLDERANHVAELGGVEVHVQQRCGPVAAGRALVHLLVLHEVGRRQEAVFQVVDPQLSRLAEGHRAEMPRELEASAVRLVDRRAELGARDVHVGLERREALVGPMRHHLAGVLRAGERLDCENREAGPIQIRRGRVHLGPGDLPGIDRALQVEIGVGHEAARRANGGRAAREVEWWEAHQLRIVHSVAGWVVHVLV